MRNIIRYLASVAIGMLCSVPAFAQQSQGPGYGPHMWDGGWHGWFFGPFMMIGFVAIVVVVVVMLVRWLGGVGHAGGTDAAPNNTALNILKERFARGEIDKAEFEERRRVLGE